MTIKRIVEDSGALDDFYMPCTAIHLERMNDGHYWLGITGENGETVHIDIAAPHRSRTRIDAMERKP